VAEVENERLKWYSEALLFAGFVFLCSATSYGPVGFDDMPRASTALTVLALVLSVVGVLGIAAALLRRSRAALVVACCAGVALAATYLAGGSSWLVVALVLIAPLFLVVSLYLVERGPRASDVD